MRFYSVPVQLEKEDKAFGGRISLRQFIYLVIGAGTGAVLFLAMYRTGVQLAVAAWVLCSVAGGILAFHRVREVDVDRYMMMLVRFRLARKKYPFRGGGS